MALTVPDATLALVALVPGYLLTYVLLWSAKLPDTYDESRRQLFSVAGSILLASGLYLPYVIVVSILERRLILLPEVRLSTEGYFVLVAVLVVVAIPLGYVLGTLYDKVVHQRRGVIRTRRQTWDYINQEAEEPIVASVRTASGAVVQGDVQYAGERQRDLLLRKPLLRDGSGNVLRRLGRYTYIPAEQIARIDLQTGLKNGRRIEPDPEPAPAPIESESESEVVVRDELETEDGTFLRVEVENPTATDCYVEVFSRFLDARGATLEERIEVVPVLEPGEKRAFVTRYGGELAGEVVDHDVSVSPVPLPD